MQLDVGILEDINTALQPWQRESHTKCQEWRGSRGLLNLGHTKLILNCAVISYIIHNNEEIQYKSMFCIETPVFGFYKCWKHF